jgi:outer membrane protein TolC
MTAAVAVAAALALAQAQAQAQPPAQPPPGPLLTYEEALRQAQARSLDLEQARAQLEQAKVIGWKVWARHLPQISAGATWTHNSEEARIPFPSGPLVRDMGSSQGPPAGGAIAGAPTPYAIQYSRVDDVVLQKQDQLGAQVQATMPLIAPELWFGISAAGAGQKQAELSVEVARRDILFGMAQLYHGAVLAKQASRITERQLAIAREHEKDARIRFEAGSMPKVALLRAEIDRARAEQDLRAAQAGYASARVALATMLGSKDDAFDVEVPAEPGLPPPSEKLEETALRDRPDVLAAGAALAAAEKGRSSTWSRYLPSVGAFGRWQWANIGGFTGKQDSWAVGLAASWTLFDGTLREAELQEAGAKVAFADAGKRSAELRARDEVVRARLDLEAAVANRDKAREQVELARENQKLVEVNFKAGAATYLEVSDANTQLTSAELATVVEDVRSRLAALRLLKAAGRFDPR